MAANIPVRITITRSDGRTHERVFSGRHNIAENNFTVGQEWTFTDIAGNLGTFRVRNTEVRETNTEIFVEAVEIE